MDKEVIINGVNVSGCEAYNDTTFNFDCIAYCLDCKDKPNCYYKQLQRLQAKNEELKKELDIAKINYANEMDYQNLYKQALKKIKYIVTTINGTVAGGTASPKQEWLDLYRYIVTEVSRIISEVINE